MLSCGRVSLDCEVRLVDEEDREVPEGEPGEIQVRAAFGISGLYKQKPLTETSINTALGLSFEEAERQSPLFWPAPARLALDAVVGGAESEEYLKQSRRIVDVWGLGGAQTRYEEIAGANHFTVIAGLADPASGMSRRIAQLAGA